METELEAAAADSPPTRPPQYSLRALFYATTAFAAVCGLCFALPDHLAGPAIIFFSLIVPVGLLAWVIYGSGSIRRFCLGALLVTGPQALNLSEQYMTNFNWVLYRGVFTNNAKPPVAPSSEELWGAIIATGITWRPGIVSTWLIGVAAGFVFLAVQRAAVKRSPP